MADTYSTYEAKARFSEVIRKVRGGRRVVIEYRGAPVAEILPLAGAAETLAERVAHLERAGVVTTPARSPLAPSLMRRRGALKRFLAERE